MLEPLDPMSKPVLVITSLLADRAWHIVECAISVKDTLKLLQYQNNLRSQASSPDARPNIAQLEDVLVLGS
jgi:hypothetical protein